MKNYKSVLLIGLLIIASIKIEAQRSFTFGLHASPNISWIKPDVSAEVYKSDGSTMHLSYGADFNYFFIKNIGIGTGVDVVYTGGKLQYHTAMIVNNAQVPDTGILSRKIKLQYLQIPLVLIGTTGDLLGNFSIYGKFGLGTSFKLKARANDSFLPQNATDAVTTENKNIGKDISFFRESMIIGLGGTYKVAKIISVNACLTYNNGFTDILTGRNGADNTIKENGKLHYFELSLGILF
ncbi:MAG: outer membrane beta-barrel protein [Bacteroidota bacterium]